MELHKNLTFDKEKYNFSLNEPYLEYFSKALKFVNENYNEDYNRIANTKFSEVSPDFFLQEMTWCICVSGFNSKIVSKFFPKLMFVLNPMFIDIAKCRYDHWENNYCLNKSLLEIFNNKRKINAILSNSIELVLSGSKKLGWETYRDTYLNSPEKLENFAMVGPAISKHLARNIGLINFVKPDIHLKRMAKNWNFESPDILCREIQKHYDIPLGLIDLVLFFTASTFGTK